MYLKQREAIARAEEAVAARQQVLATVAHDLRGPLSTVAMRAALIRRRGTVPKVLEQAKGIETVARRMEVLMRSLLDTASLEAGGFSVTRAEWPASDLFQEAVELHEALCESKGIELKRFRSDPGLVVDADGDRVLQVLSNLLGNAIKFTPRGGTIALACDGAGAWVQFSVTDSGPGIPQEHLARLFTRFYRPGSKEGHGAGLGLFIARSIVEAHGGRIWVESEEGHGSTFRFTLPRPKAKRAAFEASPAPLPA
jgi:signal transduction histidine kinase